MAESSCHTMSKLCEESGRGEQHVINLDNYAGLTIKTEEKELQICTSEESSSCSLQECSMCGDVGLAQHLFKCLICSYRYQHTYCSRIYPRKEAHICNWCLPSEDLSETCDINNYKQEPQLLKPRPLQALEDDRILQVKKHTKAFEYLLQIAEYYNISPGANSNIDENNDIVDHEERPAMLAQQNQRWDPYIVSPSNCAEKKSFAWRGNMAKRQRNCNHNGDDIVAEERMHNINNKGSSSLNRWTRQTAKRELHLSPPRAINRRYKLLADVLC